MQAVADAVAGLGADVVCLQEAFVESAIETVTTALEAAGYEVYVDYLQVTTDPYLPCGPQDFGPLLTCYADKCQGAESPAGCVLSQCPDEFAAVPRSCNLCLAVGSQQ